MEFNLSRRFCLVRLGEVT